MNYQVCPILKDPEKYNPDLEDLINNERSRIYWLGALEQMIAKFVDKAETLNPDNPKAKEKAKLCQQAFLKLTEELKRNPRIGIGTNTLSIRALLDFNEENLRAHFPDAWRTQKERETRQALQQLTHRLKEIDAINNFHEKWLQLIKGVLAGNVFDWGSSSVVNLLEKSTDFDLTQAMETVQDRPWFIDDADLWIRRLKAGAFKSIVVFVDNAGVDFVLGILPFIRELLSLGARIVLTANTCPSLNDVTYKDLNVYLCSAAQQCNILTDAINKGKLLTVENGQKGPCLDLKRLPSELCDVMLECDLVVIEGMGRAVHTNLHTEFVVDSLKMAVLKNEWLANQLGAHQFEVVFKYEPKV
ncbi:hypothetical protein ABEB36_011763 [Hypothenemus hampei]|uniref:4'-phosphopantetheine phosphatase n=1 Tax=Hypothenemus hampei TaxID=57062 RepID=A0ABD1E967_HYPHA